jgi:hypothetical protein
MLFLMVVELDMKFGAGVRGWGDLQWHNVHTTFLEHLSTDPRRHIHKQHSELITQLSFCKETNTA